jgi:hypothetical protein
MMTLKIQVLGTAVLTLTLLGAAMWANGIPPLASRAGACLDEASAAVPAATRAAASAATQCVDPSLEARLGSR